jgi:hypothetical protein
MCQVLCKHFKALIYLLYPHSNHLTDEEMNPGQLGGLPQIRLLSDKAGIRW